MGWDCVEASRVRDCKESEMTMDMEKGKVSQ